MEHRLLRGCIFLGGNEKYKSWKSKNRGQMVEHLLRGCIFSLITDIPASSQIWGERTHCIFTFTLIAYSSQQTDVKVIGCTHFILIFTLIAYIWLSSTVSLDSFHLVLNIQLVNFLWNKSSPKLLHGSASSFWWIPLSFEWIRTKTSEL